MCLDAAPRSRASRASRAAAVTYAAGKSPWKKWMWLGDDQATDQIKGHIELLEILELSENSVPLNPMVNDHYPY